VQRPGRGASSKPASGVRRPLWIPAHGVLLAGVVAPAAWLLTGCGSGGDLISSVALPSQQATGYVEGADNVDIGASPTDDRHSGTLELTPAQREYLDALAATGVRISNELRALSIGSYVCQARAAGQGDQAVWDSVAPMVRSDVAAARAASPQAPPALDADAAVGQYIQTASQRLC
jgi:hypothetical protein